MPDAPFIGMKPRLAQFAALASLVAAALIVVASLGGILVESTYSRETAAWWIQCVGQDWVDLVVVVPWLAISATLVLGGSRRARFVLAGGLLFTVYTFLIYGFAVRFNHMFLVYCAVLGASVYGLIALAIELARRAENWFDERVPSRLLGAFQMVTAVAFAALWLLEVVPAVFANEAPASLVEVGLLTNPVHVIDLALVLPLMFAAGWLTWRRRRIGYVMVAILLVFEVLMNLNIGVLVVASYAVGVAPGFGLAIVFGVLTLAVLAMVFAILRAVRQPPALRVVDRRAA